MTNRPTRPTDRTAHTVLQPSGWTQPRGYANGIKAQGEFIVMAGMIWWDQHGRFAGGLVAQTRQALENIVAVLAEGGGKPEHIGRLTWFVRDVEEYRAALSELGAAYRSVMGRHYPVMSVVEVARLVEPRAHVEIEATAVLP